MSLFHPKVLKHLCYFAHYLVNLNPFKGGLNPTSFGDIVNAGANFGASGYMPRGASNYGEMTYLPPEEAKYGGEFNVDFEVEDGEVAIGNIALNKAYNGGTMKSYAGGGVHVFSGDKHKKYGIGGLGINQLDDTPTHIFTNNSKVTVPKEFRKFGGTFAKVAKNWSNDLENVANMKTSGEKYDRDTADLM